MQILRQLGHTFLKPNAFSERVFQVFITFLPLNIDPKNANISN